MENIEQWRVLYARYLILCDLGFERTAWELQKNENTSSVPSSRNILHSISVNTGLQIDVPAGTLLINVSTDIFNISNGLVDETVMV